MPADPEIFTGDADRFPRNSGGMQQSPSLTTLRSFATCTGLRGRGRTLKRCRGSFACQAEGRLCMCLSLPVISVAESSVALLARLPSSVGRCRAAVYNCRQKFRVRKNSPVACAIRGRGGWARRAAFECLFAFVVVGHGRRQLLWFAVTRHPTAEWLAWAYAIVSFMARFAFSLVSAQTAALSSRS